MTNEKVYIILATYNPDLGFLKKQIDSISTQSHTNWRCHITDDCSHEEIVSDILNIIQDDDRFSFSRHPKTVGVFHNFESGLLQVDQDTEYIFFADQDDIWKKDKLEHSLAAFSDASVMLVHSDLEMIDENDKLIFPSCFTFEQRDLSDFSVEQLIIKNTVTGCTLGFRKKLLPHILPFPRQGRRPAYHHDLWVAIHAAASGTIKTINSPLVQYRQHGKNVIGALKPTFWKKLTQTRSIDEWRLRKLIISDLTTCSTVPKKPELQSITGWIKKRPLNINLCIRTLRMMLTGKPDWAIAVKIMIGKQQEFIQNLLKKLFRPLKIATACIRLSKELLNPAFRADCKKALAPIIKNNPRIFPKSYSSYGLGYIIEETFQVGNFQTTTPGINFILPNLKPAHIFGGISTAIRLGIQLAKSGHTVRFVSSDLKISQQENSQLQTLLKTRFQATEADLEKLQLIDGSAKNLIDNVFSEDDIFLATFWPTAYKIENTLQKYPFKNKQFFYLIQDYEPGFYSWSDTYAMAEATYRMNYIGIYNTQLLADFFSQYKYSDINSNLILQPEIEWSRYSPPSERDILQRKKKKIVVYGRPKTDRNLFNTLVSGLRLWIKENQIISDEVEIISAGESHLDIPLGNQIKIQSIGKLTMEEYATLLRSADLGISLMLSPHPSYPPFDMAASGMIVLTNTYANKQIDLSPNFISTHPTPKDIAEAIKVNWHKLDDAALRIQGAVYSIEKLGHTMPNVTQAVSKIIRQKQHKPIALF
jgi:glycosyltransferase involved in cell wall biosynthesis